MGVEVELIAVFACGYLLADGKPAQAVLAGAAYAAWALREPSHERAPLQTLGAELPIVVAPERKDASKKKKREEGATPRPVPPATEATAAGEDVPVPAAVAADPSMPPIAATPLRDALSAAATTEPVLPLQELTGTSAAVFAGKFTPTRWQKARPAVSADLDGGGASSEVADAARRKTDHFRAMTDQLAPKTAQGRHTLMYLSGAGAEP